MKEKQIQHKKIKLLFVCLGNICRSPAAEGIMKKYVESQGVSDSFYIDSAGTGGWHIGQLPDARMRKHGARRGYDFCSRARKFDRADFDKFDYIIVMDDENYNDVYSLAKSDEHVKKIYRITDFSKHYTYDHVPDPYYSNADGFELTLNLLEDACKGFFEFLIKEYALQK